MTKENYTQMTNEQLSLLVRKLQISNRRLKIYLIGHQSSLYNEIVSRTKFLDDWYKNKTVPILARLYCIEHNLKSQPICKNPNCKHHNPAVGWMNGVNRFRDYCCIYCANNDPIHQQKMQDTMENNYGVRHALQSKTFLDKSKNTCRKNNGVDFPQQSQTIRDKTHKTNLDNLGVEYPLESEIIKEKVKITNNNSYGVDWVFQSEKVKNKIKQSVQSIYGVDNVSKSDEIKLLKEQTTFSNYGVLYYSQTSEFHKCCHKRYTNSKYPDMTFATSWEFKVYDFLTEHNILFEYQPDISIHYEYRGISHTYHPDFLVNGRIYEVKGDHFFRINEETGKEEMYCPWRKQNISDEEYMDICRKEEAKHQCMIAHNVIILRKAQIDNLDSVFLLD